MTADAIHTDISVLRRVAWSPDGRYLAAIGDGPPETGGFTMVEVYRVSTGELVTHLKSDVEFWGNPGAVQFSPDGRYLAAGSAIIRLWNTSDWSPATIIKGPYQRGFVAGGVTNIVFSSGSDRLYVAYSMVVWPETVRIPTREIAGELNDPKGVEHQRLGIRHADTLMAFDVRSGSRIFARQVTGTGPGRPTQFGKGLHFLPPDHLLSFRTEGPAIPMGIVPFPEGAISYDAVAEIRSSITGDIEREFHGLHTMGVAASAVDRSGRYFATATDAGARKGFADPVSGDMVWIDNRDPIRIWSIGSGNQVQQVGSSSSGTAAEAIEFLDADRLLTCSIDRASQKTVVVWDLKQNRQSRSVRTQADNADVYFCAASPDGSVVARPIGSTIFLLRIE